MAKAKETPAGEEPAETTNFDAGTEVSSEALKSVEAGLADALQEIAKLHKQVDKLSHAPAAPVATSEKGEESSKSRNKIMDRAAAIAGKMASASSIEGLLYGSHELTISLSSIRLAITMDKVADAIKENPELLNMKIQDAHAKLEELFRPAPVVE